jgi:chlorite dismutase
MVMHDPRVPETSKGWSLLHQMFRVRWEAWRALPDAERRQRAASTVDALSSMPHGEDGATALTTLLGHKGDLMLIHFRRDFDALQAAQLPCPGCPSLPSGADDVRTSRSSSSACTR